MYLVLMSDVCCWSTEGYVHSSHSGPGSRKFHSTWAFEASEADENTRNDILALKAPVGSDLMSNVIGQSLRRPRLSSSMARERNTLLQERMNE